MTESPQSTPPAPAPADRFNRFDMIVGAVILGLLAVIGLVILAGDRVGVRVLRAEPQGEAHTTSWITLQFSEDMARDSVLDYLTVEPAIDGEARWNGPTLIYQPSGALQPGTTYTVALDPGPVSTEGRRVLQAQAFSFTVRSPRVAYLAPSDSSPQNVWTVDPAAPDEAEQVTFSEGGIFNFAFSPDGTQLAYAEHDRETGTVDLALLDLATGEAEPLLDCPDSDCTTPAWRPDGQVIAYERLAYNSDFNVGASPTRVWLLDLSTDPPTNRPLFADTQVVSYGPVWSPDGTRIAVYDSRSTGIMVYTFETDSVQFIPTQQGSLGAFSPDGTQMVYPELILGHDTTRTHLAIANLETGAITQLNDPEDPVDDERAIWAPDGQSLIVGRRYLDERYTPGRQIYRVALATADTKPVIVEPDYYHGFFEWDPAGQQIVVQRFPQPGEIPSEGPIRPEIWVYNGETTELSQVATNAFLPQWMP